MASAAELLRARQTRKTRPEHYEELLIEPLIDGTEPPSDPAELTEFGSYLGWEHDHAHARRFYVAGIKWFTGATGINQATLMNFREDAHEKILTETSWAEMPDPDNTWNTPLGKPQIRHATLVEPMPFAKAAQVLMTCEIACDALLADSKKRVRVPPGITSGQGIHGYMGIFPACSSIDDFTTDFLARLKANFGDQTGKMAKAAGLRSAGVLTAMTEGETVTRETAVKIAKFIEDNFRGSNITVGDVRARPGLLGQGNATKLENFDVK